jgi:hypothetical protein
MMRYLCLILVLLFASSVYAADLHVGASATGNESGSDADNLCALTYANTNLSAGETAYLYDTQGTYTSQTISPTNSGSQESVITYKNADGNTPVLDDTGETIGAPLGYGVYLDGDDYIVIDGITIQNQEVAVAIYNGSDHIEIKNCTIHDALYTPGGTEIWHLVRINDNGGSACTNNWIHDNTIYNGGFISGSGCGDEGGIIQVGADDDDTASNNNTIEDNILYHGGHNVVVTFTKNNVIRNNVVHNEGWMSDDNPNCNPDKDPWDGTGKWGSLNIVINDGSNVSPLCNLIEGNRVGHAGSPPDDDGAEGITFTGTGIIIRYNKVFNNGCKSIYAKQITDGDSDNNRIFNNSLYRIGYAEAIGADFNNCSAMYFSENSDNNVLKTILSMMFTQMLTSLMGLTATPCPITGCTV